MMSSRRVGAAGAVAAVCVLTVLGSAAVQAKQPDESSVIRGVDASVKARIDGIAGYTVTEHYAVYRKHDETHPVAEMTVKTEYRKETGKSYTILSQSGSEFIRNHVLEPLLDYE